MEFGFAAGTVPASSPAADGERAQILRPDFEGASALAGLDRDGFVTFPAFLSSQHLAELRNAFDERLGSMEKGTEVDLGCRWSDASAAPFLRVLLDERLLALLAEICGLPFVALRLELFGKEPGSKTEIPWHQDTYTTHVGFRWTEELAASGKRPHPVTLWVALDEASPESGGMEMVRARHRELMGMSSAIPESALEGSERVPYNLQPGQAGLHHPLAPHRSLPNTTDRPRRAFLFRFAPWTEALQARSDADCALHMSDLLVWRSSPLGRFAWRPNDSQALAAGYSLNRPLVCRHAAGDVLAPPQAGADEGEHDCAIAS